MSAAVVLLVLSVWRGECPGGGSVLLPELAGEEHQDGHDFQSAHEHQQAEQPLDDSGQRRP